MGRDAKSLRDQPTSLNASPSTANMVYVGPKNWDRSAPKPLNAGATSPTPVMLW